ncbi:hypothetical protein OS125_01040 [Corynebacterium sp. P7003]|uniref:Secreted protein n=1 Tax=Corynebacterium pygosceleis TaxID=2800406 RepID=A0ABT3WP55_9CORY|nr:hypothetical protein [Corynebacterium pygosceleis]MCX7443833.1 hypothetical protein [Corynebacterium pygosceleis]
MIANRGTRVVAVVVATAILGTGCGRESTETAGDGGPAAQRQSSPSTPPPPSTSGVPTEESGGSSPAFDTGGQTPDDPDGETSVGGTTPRERTVASIVPPDPEAKRWGGDDYDRALAAEMPADPLYPGDQVEVLGQPAVICAAGGFYGVHYIAAPEQDGCATAQAVMSDAFGSEDATTNVHFTAPRSVGTGDGTVLSCVEKGNILFDCRDPEGRPHAWFW